MSKQEGVFGSERKTNELDTSGATEPYRNIISSKISINSMGIVYWRTRPILNELEISLTGFVQCLCLNPGDIRS